MSEDISETEGFSWFSDIEQLPQREIYSIDRQFKEDDCEHKLDFAFPCYHDENGKPWTLPVVKIAENVLVSDSSLSREYLHPLGYETFNKTAITLLLGEHSTARIENRAFGIQTLSATGAVRVGAEFLANSLGMVTVYSTEQIADDTEKVFLNSGFLEYKQLRYFNHFTLTLDMAGLLEDLSQAVEGSVVFLQVSGHNPTGCDPTMEDWQKILEQIIANKLFPFLYSPFQGFASGDINQDVAPVRLMEERGLEFFCAQSFAWNFGLYNERAGCLATVVNDTNKVNPIKSHLLSIAGCMYSTPPSHGARIVAFILGDRMMFDNWKETVASVADRLRMMRVYLREELERLGAPGTWAHITNQIGIFCFTGLSEIQVEHLKKQYHIYLLSNGRMNISGLNLDNVEYVARAVYETLTVIPPCYSMDAM